MFIGDIYDSGRLFPDNGGILDIFLFGKVEEANRVWDGMLSWIQIAKTVL